MSTANYTYSYSGADCDAFAFFPGSGALKMHIERKAKLNTERNKLWEEHENKKSSLANKSDNPYGLKAKLEPNHDLGEEVANPGFFEPIKLSQMATISISIHEAKSPVRRLGERAAHGYTRGIRTIAGTIVFLIIEDHPLRMLAAKDPANIYPELIGWSRDLQTKGVGSGGGSEIRFDNKISTLISPLNIMLRYQTELAANGNGTAGGSMMLEGVEFVNEGIVTSVNDMVTEVVCQFVAQDIKPFTDLNKRNSDEIIESYNKHRGKALYEPYYRSKINDWKVQEKQLDPRQIGNTSIRVEGFNGS
tara:strand:- start:15299 stop:16213 length:915 start_codon:yes stop_codon:yes gene_type:complete